MNSIVILGLIFVLAYSVQLLLGMKQLKNFTKIYHSLRQKGRVAIGRRPGKISSGTIVMFAIDENGLVLDAQKMQGVTVLSTFKAMPTFIGQDIHYFDSYNPLVRDENKFLQIAIEDARDVFLKMEVGRYEEKLVHPLLDIKFYLRYFKYCLQQKNKNKKKRSSS